MTWILALEAICNQTRPYMELFYAMSCMPLKTLGPIGPRAVGERVKVSVWISLEAIEKGDTVFFRFSSFLLYRNCKRLREFE